MAGEPIEFPPIPVDPELVRFLAEMEVIRQRALEELFDSLAIPPHLFEGE